MSDIWKEQEKEVELLNTQLAELGRKLSISHENIKHTAQRVTELEAKLERLKAVTPEMNAAGMEAWDLSHSLGERSWPNMLDTVYEAMQKAALEGKDENPR